MGIDLSDIFVIAGLLLMAAGLYFVYAPLALIIPGVILLVIGFYSAIKKARD